MKLMYFFTPLSPSSTSQLDPNRPLTWQDIKMGPPYSLTATALFAEAEKKCEYTVSQILKELWSALDSGYERHTLQCNPHLVLLDLEWYDKELRPILSKWTLLWLYNNFIGAVNVDKEVLLDYIQGINVENITKLSKTVLLPIPKNFSTWPQTG
jgi:hypothetical protein